MRNVDAHGNVTEIEDGKITSINEPRLRDASPGIDPRLMALLCAWDSVPGVTMMKGGRRQKIVVVQP